MATTKAQQKAVQKYVAEKYDRIVLTMPKGEKDRIKRSAELTGESVNAFINRIIQEKIQEE